MEPLHNQYCCRTNELTVESIESDLAFRHFVQRWRQYICFLNMTSVSVPQPSAIFAEIYGERGTDFCYTSGLDGAPDWHRNGSDLC